MVDDADLNVTLLADLVRTVGYWPPDAPPVRLLLLARHTTGWWDTLNQRTTGLAAELADSPLMLRDGELSLTERAEHHSGALAAFAAHLPHAAAPVEQIAPVLANPAFANPLLVHMHALLTVCGAQVPTTGTQVRERVLDAVLDRERHRWDTTFPPRMPTGGARTRHQAVTAATLIALPTETAAAQAMRVISELAPEAAAGARAAVATWLHELYPGSDPPWVAPLRPDLLAEQLLAACPQLSELVLAGYGEIKTREQLEQLLGELTRADARTQVREALSQLLNAHLPGLLAAAIGNPSSRLPDLLSLALTHCPQPEAAAALASQLPKRSTGLAALAATVTSQATDHYRQLAAARPDAFTPNLAASLSNLALALAGLGRGEEALAAAGEAVSLYRQLAVARPDAFTPNLAASLDNLSVALADLGRGEEKLAAAGEAAAIFRQLAVARPDAFTPNLARSLSNLSIALAGLGRGEEALAAAGEAVSLYRQLAAARPDAFTPELAKSLTNLSAVLTGLGRGEERLAAAGEAVAIFRQLAAAGPDAFTPELARSLTNLSNGLADLGRREQALAAAGEAAAIFRQLAVARPDAFTPELARSLSNLSSVLTGLGRGEEALAAAGEAVSLYRQLAAARPDAFTPELAKSLTNLSAVLTGLGRGEEALAPAGEAVAIFRQLAAARPDAFTPELAESLTNLAGDLGRLGRVEEALAAAGEAAAIFRQLAAARPDAFTSNLARSLTNVAAALARLGRGEEALAAAGEAAALRHRFVAARPDAFTRVPPSSESGSLEEVIESALRAEAQSDWEHRVREGVGSANVYALGQPAGDTSVPGHGTASDLLHFTIDDAGAEIVVLPVFTNPTAMREALIRNPEWQTHSVLQINGGALLDNIDDDVTVVINPWTDLEYQLPPRQGGAG